MKPEQQNKRNIQDEGLSLRMSGEKLKTLLERALIFFIIILSVVSKLPKVIIHMIFDVGVY